MGGGGDNGTQLPAVSGHLSSSAGLGQYPRVAAPRRDRDALVPIEQTAVPNVTWISSISRSTGALGITLKMTLTPLSLKDFQPLGESRERQLLARSHPDTPPFGTCGTGRVTRGAARPWEGASAGSIYPSRQRLHTSTCGRRSDATPKCRGQRQPAGSFDRRRLARRP